MCSGAKPLRSVRRGRRQNTMAKLPDFEQWIDAIAPVVKLDIAPDQRAAVKANLKTAAKMAAILEKVALSDDTGPAPVYRA